MSGLGDNQNDPDLVLATKGGDSFDARLKQMNDATSGLNKAKDDLNKAVTIKDTLDSANAKNLKSEEILAAAKQDADALVAKAVKDAQATLEAAKNEVGKANAAFAEIQKSSSEAMQAAQLEINRSISDANLKQDIANKAIASANYDAKKIILDANTTAKSIIQSAQDSLNSAIEKNKLADIKIEDANKKSAALADTATKLAQQLRG